MSSPESGKLRPVSFRLIVQSCLNPEHSRSGAESLKEVSIEIRERIGEWMRPLYAQFARSYGEELDAGRDDIESAANPVEDAMYFTELMLQDAIRERASDVHFEPFSTGVRVRFRIDGVLLDTMSLPLGPVDLW